ncbi:hypothetical protein C2E23DRAFT_859795 [Lenzites betulinus]|nr:hypothetical protein C2E23DRAFT_859795 [Lenzites betulinus]
MPRIVIDNRVRAIVEEELQTAGIVWRSKLHKCPLGSRHGINTSFGGATFRNAGLVFEICLSPMRCYHHQKPLVPEAYMRTRFNIWVRISALEPPPNNNDILGGKAILERESIRDDILALDPSALATPRTAYRVGRRSLHLSSPASSPSRRSGSSTSRHSSRSSTGSSQRGPLGRPPNPVCEVIVYVYVQGRHNPWVIHAQGTPRDEVVEFRFRQPSIATMLQIDVNNPFPDVYTMWHRASKTWSTHPKPHQAVFLAPGERVLYRELYVSQTPNLEHYLALLLPPIGAPDTRALVPATPSSYASLRRKADSPRLPKTHSLPGSPVMVPDLDQLPFHLDDLPEPSKPVKRSGSPLTTLRPKRRRTGNGNVKGETIDLTLDDMVLPPQPSGLPSVVRTRRGRKGKGKAFSLSADVIEISD